MTSGDLCVRASADDAQVAFHGVRNLAALGRGAVVVRWVQQGFRSALPADSKATRNLLGFKDGTNNLDPADEELMARNVWVGPEDEPAWMRGGTYMVVRRSANTRSTQERHLRHPGVREGEYMWQTLLENL